MPFKSSHPYCGGKGFCTRKLDACDKFKGNEKELKPSRDSGSACDNHTGSQSEELLWDERCPISLWNRSVKIRMMTTVAADIYKSLLCCFKRHL